ncbi:hypothetical protein [Streptomyces sp. NBC_00620]|uniref:hypothetical protein n=1 Tax=Streptomyces sp. NBC_00620 TaxID=2903666 RepID=UPI002252E9A0|nr:hypothetical protein [Streptomyces sp. NBC_00620]MCX4976487.1 hypothetical protein [Streptomyces sp. NBC_00620]
MQPHVTQALQDWYGAWSVHERAAQAAFTAAFPALNLSDPRCRCYGPTLRWQTPGEGEGKVCLDDHGRATIEFEHVPKEAVGAAMNEVFGADWFDEGPGGFAAAAPGEYHYEDESTYAEYAIDVHDDGTASIGIAYVKVDDIVTILDLLEQALAEHRAI